MRKGVLAAVGLALLAAVSWSAAPAQAMAISAPAALKGAATASSSTTCSVAVLGLRLLSARPRYYGGYGYVIGRITGPTTLRYWLRRRLWLRLRTALPAAVTTYGRKGLLVLPSRVLSSATIRRATPVAKLT